VTKCHCFPQGCIVKPIKGAKQSSLRVFSDKEDFLKIVQKSHEISTSVSNKFKNFQQQGTLIF